jgi:predicted GNAT family acetyltransferase
MIYIKEDEIPVAFAGFRNMHMLHSGKIIYIDDLSTLPQYRGKGYAGKLLDYLHNLAVETGKWQFTSTAAINEMMRTDSI